MYQNVLGVLVPSLFMYKDQHIKYKSHDVCNLSLEAQHKRPSLTNRSNLDLAGLHLISRSPLRVPDKSFLLPDLTTTQLRVVLLPSSTAQLQVILSTEAITAAFGVEYF